MPVVGLAIMFRVGLVESERGDWMRLTRCRDDDEERVGRYYLMRSG